jgi:serine protein kinase
LLLAAGAASEANVEARRYLQSVGDEVKGAFVQQRMILAFEEYMEEVFLRAPRSQARNAAQYVKDVFDHFGAEQRETPMGQVRRFKLFDATGPDMREGRVAGQEDVQNAIYRIVGNFVRAGRVNKLILLHGPNGSAKSSIIASLMRAMEQYSREPVGALYRLNWIFPSSKLVKGSIGFGDKGGSGSGDTASFAHLEGEAIDARLVCEMKDPPLFLIPRAERKKLLEKSCEAKGSEQSKGASDFVLSDYILDGELCHKCRQIYSGLLQSYGGDYARVLRHVQVERFYVSKRYQLAAVTVEPQMSVDASMHQVTADKSIANLPTGLQNLAIFEPHGPLVAANRGLIEYSDLLKRPLEAYKYLLGSIETAQVPMDAFLLQLDQVLIASSNEKHLSAFKEIPDFASFKGRIELVRVPYLRRASVENEIYAERVTTATVGKHVAPHATQTAALWAVLTRLKKPIPDRYPNEVREVIDDLAPLEKLELYDTGTAPDRLGLAQAKELKKALPQIAKESDSYPNYEGRIGASAREVKTVLFNAAQSENHRCLTAQAVLEELDALVKDKSVYEFLQQEVVDGYHEHEAFVRRVEGEFLDAVDDECRDAMGLVSDRQYHELFERYVQLVSSWVKGEKVKNRVTGAYDKPDENVMVEMEGIVMGEGDDRGEFRRSLIASIGASKLEHPDDITLDYAKIFPDLFRRLRDHYFGERKKVIRRVRDNYYRFLSDEQKSLLPREVAQVETMMATMTSKYGYCEHCARDAILFLMKRRYAD